MDDQLLGYRYVVGITTICGSLALGLAAIGVYGILSFAVSERTHEIGVRMALGAGTSEILLLISRWGLQLTATGVILGVVATLGLARLLSGLLFGVGAFDLAAFAAGVAVLCIAALLACWVPVWRAISVNPVVTLRQE
jgi:ABC-type antimicrobial peptide transport system permease subunit